MKTLVVGIGLLILGCSVSKDTPIYNYNNLKVYTKEHEEEGRKKIDINSATLQDFIDCKCGVGEKKYAEIVAGRPYKNVGELREKGILGYYSYKRLKEIAVVKGGS